MTHLRPRLLGYQREGNVAWGAEERGDELCDAPLRHYLLIPLRHEAYGDHKEDYFYQYRYEAQHLLVLIAPFIHYT